MSVSLGLVLLASVAGAEPSMRRAVLVGSNDPIDGRARLRYAHADAKALADVLTSNGGFSADQVVTLLDPKPGEVLAALEVASTQLRDAGSAGLLLFYYSGHADEGALYPGGLPLPHAELRRRLADPAGVRVGIIDACRGGGWTQAKGLKPVAGFDVRPAPLGSEGLALIAASSGLEDAHEAEELQGSFFTHHFVAGLRGAADATADGQVTLNEAFAYANQRTIRDTASRSTEPQHPSFDFRLRGRQDVVLASLGSATTALILAQKEGPLEVVQLSTGVTVVEATPGAQVLRLSLPPGQYLVRRLVEGQVRSKEVSVTLNEETRVEESSLTLVGAPMAGAKGLSERPGRVLFGTTGAGADFESLGAVLTVGVGIRVNVGWRIWSNVELGYIRVSPIGSSNIHGTWALGSIRFNIVDALFTPFVEAGIQARMIWPADAKPRVSILPTARLGVEFVSRQGFGVFETKLVVGARLEGGLQKSVTHPTPWFGSFGISFTVGGTL